MQEVQGYQIGHSRMSWSSWGYLCISAFLCISLHFSAFLFISLHFYEFVCIYLNFSDFSTFLCILHVIFWRSVPSSHGRHFFSFHKVTGSGPQLADLLSPLCSDWSPLFTWLGRRWTAPSCLGKSGEKYSPLKNIHPWKIFTPGPPCSRDLGGGGRHQAVWGSRVRQPLPAVSIFSQTVDGLIFYSPTKNIHFRLNWWKCF